MMLILSRRALALAVALTCLAIADARAQAWPERPVRLIVPFAAGGNTDGIARIMAQRLSETLGAQFVV